MTPSAPELKEADVAVEQSKEAVKQADVAVDQSQQVVDQSGTDTMEVDIQGADEAVEQSQQVVAQTDATLEQEETNTIQSDIQEAEDLAYTPVPKKKKPFEMYTPLPSEEQGGYDIYSDIGGRIEEIIPDNDKVLKSIEKKKDEVLKEAEENDNLSQEEYLQVASEGEDFYQNVKQEVENIKIQKKKAQRLTTQAEVNEALSSLKNEIFSLDSREAHIAGYDELAKEIVRYETGTWTRDNIPEYIKEKNAEKIKKGEAKGYDTVGDIVKGMNSGKFHTKELVQRFRMLKDKADIEHNTYVSEKDYGFLEQVADSFRDIWVGYKAGVYGAIDNASDMVDNTLGFFSDLYKDYYLDDKPSINVANIKDLDNAKLEYAKQQEEGKPKIKHFIDKQREKLKHELPTTFAGETIEYLIEYGIPFAATYIATGAIGAVAGASRMLSPALQVLKYFTNPAVRGVAGEVAVGAVADYTTSSLTFDNSVQQLGKAIQSNPELNKITTDYITSSLNNQRNEQALDEALVGAGLGGLVGVVGGVIKAVGKRGFTKETVKDLIGVDSKVLKTNTKNAINETFVQENAEEVGKKVKNLAESIHNHAGKIRAIKSAGAKIKDSDRINSGVIDSISEILENPNSSVVLKHFRDNPVSADQFTEALSQASKTTVPEDSEKITRLIKAQQHFFDDVRNTIVKLKSNKTIDQEAVDVHFLENIQVYSEITKLAKTASGKIGNMSDAQARSVSEAIKRSNQIIKVLDEYKTIMNNKHNLPNQRKRASDKMRKLAKVWYDSVVDGTEISFRLDNLDSNFLQKTHNAVRGTFRGNLLTDVATHAYNTGGNLIEIGFNAMTAPLTGTINTIVRRDINHFIGGFSKSASYFQTFFKSAKDLASLSKIVNPSKEFLQNKQFIKSAKGFSETLPSKSANEIGISSWYGKAIYFGMKGSADTAYKGLKVMDEFSKRFHHVAEARNLATIASSRAKKGVSKSEAYNAVYEDIMSRNLEGKSINLVDNVNIENLIEKVSNEGKEGVFQKSSSSAVNSVTEKLTSFVEKGDDLLRDKISSPIPFLSLKTGFIKTPLNIVFRPIEPIAKLFVEDPLQLAKSVSEGDLLLKWKNGNLGKYIEEKTSKNAAKTFGLWAVYEGLSALNDSGSLSVDLHSGDSYEVEQLSANIGKPLATLNVNGTQVDLKRAGWVGQIASYVSAFKHAQTAIMDYAQDNPNLAKSSGLTKLMHNIGFYVSILGTSILDNLNDSNLLQNADTLFNLPSHIIKGNKKTVHRYLTNTISDMGKASVPFMGFSKFFNSIIDQENQDYKLMPFSERLLIEDVKNVFKEHFDLFEHVASGGKSERTVIPRRVDNLGRLVPYADSKSIHGLTTEQNNAFKDLISTGDVSKFNVIGKKGDSINIDAMLLISGVKTKPIVPAIMGSKKDTSLTVVRELKKQQTKWGFSKKLEEEILSRLKTEKFVSNAEFGTLKKTKYDTKYNEAVKQNIKGVEASKPLAITKLNGVLRNKAISSNLIGIDKNSNSYEEYRKIVETEKQRALLLGEYEGSISDYNYDEDSPKMDRNKASFPSYAKVSDKVNTKVEIESGSGRNITDISFKKEVKTPIITMKALVKDAYAKTIKNFRNYVFSQYKNQGILLEQARAENVQAKLKQKTPSASVTARTILGVKANDTSQKVLEQGRDDTESIHFSDDPDVNEDDRKISLFSAEEVENLHSFIDNNS